jgi:RimJ/RimL family protein N-acetyltransferase
MVGTDKLRLRALTEEDLDQTRMWINDPVTAQLMDHVRPVAELNHRAWYQRIVTDPAQVVFAVESTMSAVHIGNCGLKDIDVQARRAELWMYLGESYRGKGYGTHACWALCQYGFTWLNLHRIFLHVLASNLPAIALYEKVGFKREGLLRDAVFVKGRYEDCVVMGLLQHELEAACASSSVNPTIYLGSARSSDSTTRTCT